MSSGSLSTALIVRPWATVCAVRLALLWAVGFAARASLLAVPPLIPALHRDLVLSETAVGVLGGSPILLFSAGALAGALVIARLGARRAAIAGLVVIALAGALRGVGPSVMVLFAMTFAMAIGIALTQLAIPSLVAAWERRNVGRATAAYGNGMLVGEILGAAVTATVFLALVGGSWEVALAIWSVPVVAVAIVLLSQPDTALPEIPVRWWPEWRDGRVWTIGLCFGSASLTYWGANAHLPDYLSATGHAGDVPIALASLNGFQLVGSALIGAWPAAFVARRWPFVACGILTILGAAGLMAMGGDANGAWAGALGAVSALVFLLALALPPLLVAPSEVNRFAAGIFAVSYAFAFAGALVAGVLWDTTGIPATALAPTAFAGALLAFLGPRIDVRRWRDAI